MIWLSSSFVLSRPWAIAVAVGSLMICKTWILAIMLASLVAYGLTLSVVEVSGEGNNDVG